MCSLQTLGLTFLLEIVIGIPQHTFSSIAWPMFECSKHEGSDTADVIYHRYVCDGFRDCDNGKDELFCKDTEDTRLSLYRDCESNEFRCSDNRCISEKARCDIWKDCEDGSDELDCGRCSHELCSNGHCMPKSWFKDGEIDCPAECGENAFTDENIAEEKECIFICNYTECVTSSMLHNGVQDCSGPEGRNIDEYLGRLEEWKCPNTVYGWAPRCILQRDRYGEVIGCRDMSHLSNCENFECPSGFIKCPASYCIPVHAVGDGTSDCPFGEDDQAPIFIEISVLRSEYYLCGETTILHPDLVCDGFAHCPGREDEMDCRPSCSDGFLCFGGTVTFYNFSSSENITDISFIEKEVRYINISNAHIPDFFFVYPKGHFKSLIHLYLSNSCISDIVEHQQTVRLDYRSMLLRHYQSFEKYCGGPLDMKYQDFTRVTQLDLSYNLIHSLGPCNIIANMPNLNYLNLSNNQALTDLSFAFAISTKLATLDLSNTALSTLDRDLFLPLPRLSIVDLRGTRILKLSSIFPSTVTVINLQNSPVQLVEDGIFDHISKIVELQASSYQICCPQLRGKSISEKRCEAPEDALSSCSDLMREPVLRILLWLISSLALVGNITVIIYRLIVDRKSLNSGFGLFVINLSISDLLMGVYLFIIATADVIYRGNYVLYSLSWVKSQTCQVAGFLSTLSSEASALFIFFITVDRYFVMRFPFGEHKMSRAISGLCCIGTWIFGSVIALIPLLPSFEHWVIYSSSSMCLGLPLTSDNRPGTGYSVAVFVGFNFILFLLIATGQLGIYCAINQRPHLAEYGRAALNRRQQDIKVAKQLSLIVLTDFCCWFPIGIMGILAQMGTKIGNDAFAWSAVLVLPLNSALNPILYTIPALRRKWAEYTAKKYGIDEQDMKQERKQQKTSDYSDQVDTLELMVQDFMETSSDSVKISTLGHQQKLSLASRIKAVKSQMKQLEHLFSTNDNESSFNEDI